MVGAVGEEEVDDEADDGEDEDAQAPEQLVDGRAVGLEDLDCVRGPNWLANRQTHREAGGQASWDACGKVHTEDDNVEDQDDEADDATASAILPTVVDGAGGDLLCHWGSEGEGGQAELEEEGVDVLVHDAGGTVVSSRLRCC